MDDRTLYEFKVGDLVRHRTKPLLFGVVEQISILVKDPARDFVIVKWFGDNSTRKYPNFHLIKVN